MSILTYMDFPDLSRSDRKQMAEIEEQLRGESGRLPSESELRRRAEFLQASEPVIRKRDRMDFLSGIVILLILVSLIMVTEYDAIGIELPPSAEYTITGLVFAAGACGAFWFERKFKNVPKSSRSAKLELMLIKSILNRRDHKR